MDIIFNFLKKSLVLTIFLIFGFVFTYVPQPFINNSIPVAEAQIPVIDAANLATNVTTAEATLAQQVKEYGLDGIGWVLGKAIVSSMVASTIEWINSGFEGSPAFVQDLGGFLLNVADEVAGSYIENLGGDLSFLCSPFKLNIQIALALEYQVAREKRPYEGCTLTGVIDNIEEFTNGNFSAGGWDDWFDITMNPEIYTPYGQLLAARAGMQAAITDAQGNEIEFLRFGKGFLSSEVCDTVDTPNGPEQKCKVTLPGEAIADTLNQSLGAGQNALIQADEINELIAALLGQVAQKALTGAAGLLGLSENTGYTYQGFDAGSVTGQMVQDSNNLSNNAISASANTLTTSLALQRSYKTLATTYASRFNTYRTNFNIDSSLRQAAQDSYNDTQAVIGKTTDDIVEIQVALTRYNQLQAEYNNTSTTPTRKQQISAEQAQILNIFNSQGYYTQANYNASQVAWEGLINAITSSI